MRRLLLLNGSLNSLRFYVMLHAVILIYSISDLYESNSDTDMIHIMK